MHISHVLAASDVITLIGGRALRLEQQCEAGSHSMLAVKASATDLKGLVDQEKFQTSCENGPAENVIGGESSAIKGLSDHLASRNISSTNLRTPYAFHTSQVDPILDEYQRMAQGVTFNAPEIPMVLSLLATVVKESGTFGPEYVVRHARETVKFSSSVQVTFDDHLVDDKTVWLEIGPHPVCSGLIKATCDTHVTTLPSLRKGENN